LVAPRPHTATPFPYTTLFRSQLELTRYLLELSEDSALVLCGNADAGIAHFESQEAAAAIQLRADAHYTHLREFECVRDQIAQNLDRKSTRLNSSHVKISYAVF